MYKRVVCAQIEEALLPLLDALRYRAGSRGAVWAGAGWAGAGRAGAGRLVRGRGPWAGGYRGGGAGGCRDLRRGALVARIGLGEDPACPCGADRDREREVRRGEDRPGALLAGREVVEGQEGGVNELHHAPPDQVDDRLGRGGRHCPGLALVAHEDVRGRQEEQGGYLQVLQHAGDEDGQLQRAAPTQVEQGGARTYG